MVDAELGDLPDKWPLKFWSLEEGGWKDAKRKLDWMDENKISYNPKRANIFRALSLCPLGSCTCCWVLQDPYLDEQDASGVALSATRITPSLKTIFRELARHRGNLGELLFPSPSTGCLEPWCAQGVLLLNAVHTVEVGRDDRGQQRGYTHKYWPEWQTLSREIITKLSDKGEVVFVFFGAEAQKLVKYVNTDNRVNTVMNRVHPSPKAQHWTKHPFVGSGTFGEINQHLNFHGREPIDWRLE